MTQEERQMLADLAAKIAQTPAPPRDPEAEEFIRKNIGSRPDALYLMTQTVLIQNMAIQHAQQQIQDLQQRSQQSGYSSGAGSSFLGQAPPQSRPQSPQYAAPQPAYASPAPAAGLTQGSSGSSGPGFLKGAAQTAAGVAAGALAFEGIRSLFEHPGFGLGGSGFMGGGAPAEETVINNYYDSPADSGRQGEHLADTSDDQYTDSDDAQTQDADYDDSNDYSDSDDSGSDDVA